MPNTYKLTAARLLATGSTLIYTVSSSVSSSIIKSLYVSNVATSGSINLDVIVNKSGSAVNFFLITSASVPVQTSFQPISDTLVLESGDSLSVGTNIISSSNILLSYMEIT